MTDWEKLPRNQGNHGDLQFPAALLGTAPFAEQNQELVPTNPKHAHCPLKETVTAPRTATRNLLHMLIGH